MTTSPNGAAPANAFTSSTTPEGAGQQPISLLYRQPTLLDRTRHAGLHVKPVTDWSVARDMNAVFVTGLEFPDVSREFTIAFVPSDRDAEGRTHVVPVALLGLRERENLYVAADGSWTARYLPAFLRRYPFAYARISQEQVGIMFDGAWAGFNQTEGDELLNAQGEATPHLDAVKQFLDRFEEEAIRTRAMCDRLLELELLRGGEINGQLANGEKVKADGFFMVDEDKLRNLPDAVVLELHRNGILALLHAHLLSMGQVNQLAARLLQHSA
jgi:hypothetical protein